MNRIPTLLFTAAALCACNRGGTDAPEAPEAPTEAEQAPADSAPAGMPCELTQSATLIESIRLESADGSCKVYLPAPPHVGEFAVRVSSAGGGDFAAVEVAGPDGTLYATSGTVTITDVSNGRVVGSLDAEDDSPPAIGTVAVAFDVPLTSP